MLVLAIGAALAVLAFRWSVVVNRMGFVRWVVDYAVACAVLYVPVKAVGWELVPLGWDGDRVNFGRDTVAVLVLVPLLVIPSVFLADWAVDRLLGGARPWRARLRLLGATAASALLAVVALLPVWLYTEVEVRAHGATAAEFFRELARTIGGSASAAAGLVTWMLSRVKRAPDAGVERQRARAA
jgi:hypothetical protein